VISLKALPPSKSKNLYSINKVSNKKSAVLNCRKGEQKGQKSGEARGTLEAQSHSKTVGRGFESSCPCQKSCTKVRYFYFLPLNSSLFIHYAGFLASNSEDGIGNCAFQYFRLFQPFRLLQHQKSIKKV